MDGVEPLNLSGCRRTSIGGIEMPYGQALHEMRPFILQPGVGPSLNNPFGGQLVFKLRGEQSNGAMTVIETVAAPGQGPPLHLHELQDEWRYVLDGEVRFRLIDDVVPAPAGAFMFIPRGAAHTWQNVGRDQAVMLAMLAPSALEGFFEQYAELAGRAASVDTFRAHAHVAGMTVVGPPLAESHPNGATTSIEG
jgi:quercetin dioxygenase-like cupin family protein